MAQVDCGRPFSHSVTHCFVQSLTVLFSHSLFCPVTHCFVQSLTVLFSHSLFFSVTHCFVQSLTVLFSHSLFCSVTHCFVFGAGVAAFSVSPWLILTQSWQSVFYIFGSLGLPISLLSFVFCLVSSVSYLLSRFFPKILPLFLGPSISLSHPLSRTCECASARCLSLTHMHVGLSLTHMHVGVRYELVLTLSCTRSPTPHAPTCFRTHLFTCDCCVLSPPGYPVSWQLKHVSWQLKHV